MSQAFPLAWPEGWPRAKDRKWSNFSTSKNSARPQAEGDKRLTRSLSVADAVARLWRELGLMGVSAGDAVISTNLSLTLDGRPRSNQGEPQDPGVAVYWTVRKQPMKVMAIDVYHRVADNIAAIAASLEAMRKIERHGGAVVMERAFTGFTALPPPVREDQWWHVLGVSKDATPAEIIAAHRQGVRSFHPDRGGEHDYMAKINAARDKGLSERALR